MNSSFQLRDKVIVISGASSGIGKSCAVQASKAGASVVLLGRNIERLQNTLDKMEENNHTIVPFDLTDHAALKLAVKNIGGSYPEINGLVLSAGVSLTAPLRISKNDNLQKIFRTNVFGTFELTRLLVKLAPTEGMSIVFISSVMASAGEKAKSVYSMSKGALLSGSRSLAIELAGKKIRVNTVSPGVIDTPMTEKATYRRNEKAYQELLSKYPLGTGKPKDVANAVQFLLSDASAYITGTDLKVDGGYTAQ